MSMNRFGPSVVLAGLTLAAACGGGSDDPPSSDASLPLTVETVLPSTSTASSVEVPTTPGASATTTAPPDSGPPQTEATAPTTAPNDDDEVDESALALLEAGLYSIPGADVHCGVDAPEVPLSLVYAFAAQGGDLYTVCAVPDDPSRTDHRLRISDPGGNRVTDLSLAATDDYGSVDLSGRSARSVIVTDTTGRRRVHGTAVSDGGGETFQIAIFLPHDRPDGDWTLEFDDRSVRTDIRRPCATGAPKSGGDPTLFNPRLRFQRLGPVEFGHCRGFPDVSGLPLDDAHDVLADHFARQGISVDINPPTTIGCGNVVVTASATPVGDVNEFAINDRSTFVNLEVELDCPTAPNLSGVDFDEAAELLDDLAARFPKFTWTADDSCVSGASVSDQTPNAGVGAARLSIDGCATTGSTESVEGQAEELNQEGSGEEDLVEDPPEDDPSDE